MELFEHHIFGDERGKLISIEGRMDVPFSIKRTFFIYDVLWSDPRQLHMLKLNNILQR